MVKSWNWNLLSLGTLEAAKTFNIFSLHNAVAVGLGWGSTCLHTGCGLVNGNDDDEVDSDDGDFSTDAGSFPLLLSCEHDDSSSCILLSDAV